MPRPHPDHRPTPSRRCPTTAPPPQLLQRKLHVRFEFIDAADQLQGRPSRKVRFAALIGLKKMTTVSVDLVTGLAPLGEPVALRLPPPLDIDGDPANRRPCTWRPSHTLTNR